jgi:hypothetical protein
MRKMSAKMKGLQWLASLEYPSSRQSQNLKQTGSIAESKKKIR